MTMAAHHQAPSLCTWCAAGPRTQQLTRPKTLLPTTEPLGFTTVAARMPPLAGKPASHISQPPKSLSFTQQPPTLSHKQGTPPVAISSQQLCLTWWCALTPCHTLRTPSHTNEAPACFLRHSNNSTYTMPLCKKAGESPKRNCSCSCSISGYTITSTGSACADE